MVPLPESCDSGAPRPPRSGHPGRLVARWASGRGWPRVVDARRPAGRRAAADQACSSTQGGRKLIRAGTLAGLKAARVRGRRAAGRFARRRPRPAAGRARNPPATRSRRRPPCRRRRPSAARSPRASPHQTWSPSDRARLPNQRVTTPPGGETSRPRRPCAHLVRNGADAPSAPTSPAKSPRRATLAPSGEFTGTFVLAIQAEPRRPRELPPFDRPRCMSGKLATCACAS